MNRPALNVVLIDYKSLNLKSQLQIIVNINNTTFHYHFMSGLIVT